MTHKFLNLLTACCMVIIVVLSACNPAAKPTPALTPIMVQLQWTHQAEFAGFYTADQNGYYAAEGLAVTFVPGGATVDNLAPVLDGRAQFCVATAEQLIIARGEDKPLRAFATLFRRSATVFISLASSGITRPQDFAGKTIRAPAVLAATLHAMTTREGVTPDQYSEVANLPTDVALFATGDVPVWGAYINTLLVMVQQAGIPINIIYPDDYGVHFYGDSLLATEDFIAKNPDLVLRFVRASLKGWKYALENPEKMGVMVQKYAPGADPSMENKKMIASLPLIDTGEDRLGWMKPEIWAGMEQTLRELGVLKQPVDAAQLYTMQFLEAIYK
jgi:NitT/TauT family transport system substrate-binding protein